MTASAARLIDLGHPLNASNPVFEDSEKTFQHKVPPRGKEVYAVGTFAMPEHYGTHLDAPFHFAAQGWTVDQIPTDRLLRPGVCVNIEKQANADQDYRLSVADLREFESKHGRIPEGAMVLVATGWDRYWNNEARYRNTRDGVLHFPGLSVEAAKFLAHERHVAGIGIDTLSVDYGPSKDFEVHSLTMPLNLYHVENARGLTALPPTGFRVLVAPLWIEGGTGAPTRIFALFD